ncbi:MAG: O-antigen ligase family protein [Planctomycetota bacterium]
MTQSTALPIPAAELDSLEREDPRWQTAHGIAACACALLITMPTTPMELSIAPIAIVGLARIVRVMPVTLTLFRSPTFLLALAFLAWTALSLLWSTDPAQGADELADLRWLVLVWLIAPVARWRLRIVACLAGGFVLGHLSQIANGSAILAGGPDWLIGRRTESRISGWWDPAVSGTILTAAIGLHLVPALLGRGRLRLLAWAAMVASFAGLIATGSRGGWLATATLLGLVTLALLVHKQSRRRVILPASAGAALLGLVIAGAAITRGEQLAGRFAEARDAVRDAWTGAGYDSDTGARIRMKAVALQAFASSPIWGTGAGGYRSWDEANPPAEPAGSTPVAGSQDVRAKPARLVHDHAHDTPLHTAATLGLVGLALGGCLLASALREGWRAIRTAPTNGSPRASLYHAAPLVALLGLLCAMPYDTLHVSGQPAAVMWLLIALCVAHERRNRPASSSCRLAARELDTPS